MNNKIEKAYMQLRDFGWMFDYELDDGRISMKKNTSSSSELITWSHKIINLDGSFKEHNNID